MLKFAANTALLFPDLDFLDRFEAAHRAGFAGVESLFTYDWPVEDQSARLERFGLTQTLLNTPMGNRDAGERGLACIPDRIEEFQSGLDLAIEYAAGLKCSRLHCVAGVIPEGLTAQAAEDCFISNIVYAVEKCAAHGIEVLIEPINRVNIPGFFLSDFGFALELLTEMTKRGGPQPRLQFDIYHCARIHGNVLGWMERCAPWIGYFQIAGVPDRHEPNIGELDLGAVLDAIASDFGDRWIGCEYNPQGDTTTGLSWMTSY